MGFPGSHSKTAMSMTMPAVAGFGTPTVYGPGGMPMAGTYPAPGMPPPGAPGYTGPYPPSATASPTAPVAAAPQPMSAELQLKCQYSASSLLRELDANRNGALEKEEWSKKRPDLKAADRSGDGVITQEELTAWIVDCAQKGVAGVSVGRFYRALTPTERLPEGLPSWFVQKDSDGDGQIALAEFSSHLTEESVGEFAKHDLNNDGFVTPAECLEAMKRVSQR